MCACSNNNCCNNQQKQAVDAKPTAELLSDFLWSDNGTWLLSYLMTVAKTGNATAPIKNALADQLAKTIAGLATENNYLRTLLFGFLAKTDKDKNSVEIVFGPGNSYKLAIPVLTEEARKSMIENLRTVIDELETVVAKRVAPQQQKMPMLFDLDDTATT